jgi:hypothetical protein
MDEREFMVAADAELARIEMALETASQSGIVDFDFETKPGGVIESRVRKRIEDHPESPWRGAGDLAGGKIGRLPFPSRGRTLGRYPRWRGTIGCLVAYRIGTGRGYRSTLIILLFRADLGGAGFSAAGFSARGFSTGFGLASCTGAGACFGSSFSSSSAGVGSNSL